MIQPNAELSIARQAKLLGISRSSVYYRPKPDSTEELDHSLPAMQQIQIFG